MKKKFPSGAEHGAAAQGETLGTARIGIKAVLEGWGEVVEGVGGPWGMRERP